MSSATFGSFGGSMDERPISVGELLRREGHQSESHDSQARRALGGVAVGAVLAFGAVVGGLVLHNAGATPSDMPVAGGASAGGAGFNGSVPVASTGTIGSHSPQVRPAANTTHHEPGHHPARHHTPSRRRQRARRRGAQQHGRADHRPGATPAPAAPCRARRAVDLDGHLDGDRYPAPADRTTSGHTSTNPGTTLQSNPGSTSTGSTTTSSNGVRLQRRWQAAERRWRPARRLSATRSAASPSRSSTGSAATKPVAAPAGS